MMRVMRSWDAVASYPEVQEGAITIGNFDGVHLGHRQIFAELQGHAMAVNGPSTLLTFEPHPRAVLFPDEEPRRLCLLHDRLRWIREAAVSAVLVLPFDRALAQCSAEDFTRKLHDSFHFKHMHVGYDFAFGRDRQGHSAMLRELGDVLNFTVSEAAAFELHGGVVSSSRIRSLIEAADFQEVEALLGRPYEVSGHVCLGEQRGRALGFPTANLETKQLVHPPAGIYAVWAGVLDDAHALHYFPAVAYLGYRPTFQGRTLILETHLLEQDINLYHSRLIVRFVTRIREDRTFKHAEALTRQIKKDCAYAQALLADCTP
ncbi:MAG: riboflavin biosynthesis protein RibF [Mariprofundaceae bacterium]|nr:riboflavin biosynthesis protein RibF [Mariprofundaceae bacterium]